jgi:predicted nuclease of predicted toxin-antitoxin system
MRFLADEDFPKRIVDWLRGAGHDVLRARTDCAGSKDSSLLELAEAEARALLTLDQDFWQISMQRRLPLARAGVVLFRVHPATPGNLNPLVRVFIECGKEWTGCVSTVSRAGIEMVPCGRAR